VDGAQSSRGSTRRTVDVPRASRPGRAQHPADNDSIDWNIDPLGRGPAAFLHLFLFTARLASLGGRPAPPLHHPRNTHGHLPPQRACRACSKCHARRSKPHQRREVARPEDPGSQSTHRSRSAPRPGRAAVAWESNRTQSPRKSWRNHIRTAS
jgi:hypothetical protein